MSARDAAFDRLLKAARHIAELPAWKEQLDRGAGGLLLFLRWTADVGDSFVALWRALEPFDAFDSALPEAADPSTTEAASLVGASPRMGAAGSVAAGRDVGVSSGCIAEGREGNTGDVRGLSGALAPASDQGLLLPSRHETSHDYRGAAHPVAGIKPGHPLVTPADDVDTVDEPANGPVPPGAGALSSSGAAGSSTVVALSSLQSALLSLNAIRNALSESAPKVLAALTETEAALRAVSEALRRDLPPVIRCTPVRQEVTLRGETE